jgi:hypothetical protein
MTGLRMTAWGQNENPNHRPLHELTGLRRGRGR